MIMKLTFNTSPKIMTNITQPKHSLLTQTILLTLVFIVWQIVAVVSSSTAISSLTTAFQFNQFALPQKTWLALLYYLFAQLILYLSFIVILWSITQLSSNLLKLSTKQTLRFGLIVWMTTIVTLLLANRICFPNSCFSLFTEALIPLVLAKIILVITSSFLLIIMLLALFSLLKKIKPALSLFTTMILLAALIPLFYFYLFSPRKTDSTTFTSSRPNIIIIGLDSVRPDSVHYYNHTDYKTPHIDAFLAQSTHFTDSLSPLARTFTAWSAILTGQYPKNNHVRFNLFPQNKLKLDNTLPALLKKEGYKTIYATDDSRFSNITKRFGFDEIIDTPPGAAELILATINDFPLSNLIINTRLGKILFPYSYGNREAYITYRPKTFTQRVDKALRSTQHKPLCLCMHLCLIHYPYFWSSLHFNQHTSEPDLYNATLQEVDKQFNAILSLLNQHHLLDHAVVILLSDHGAAMQLKGDRLITAHNYIQSTHSNNTLFKKIAAVSDKNDITLSTGHGTDVLSYTQHRTLLAFRYFTKKPNLKRPINQAVSLIDIKPTILDLLQLPAPDTDGISLRQFIEDKDAKTYPRPIFIETGLTSKADLTSKLSVKEVIKRHIKVYDIDKKTNQLLVSPSLIPALISAKQRAVYYSDWVFALYPDKNKKQISLLVNRKTGQWTDDLNTPFAKRSPLQELSKKMIRFYGNEIRDKDALKG